MKRREGEKEKRDEVQIRWLAGWLAEQMGDQWMDLIHPLVADHFATLKPLVCGLGSVF